MELTQRRPLGGYGGLVDLGSNADDMVTTLMGLVKAFEKVTHRQVWGWIEYWGFTRPSIAVVLSCNGMEQRMVVDGCCTEPLQTYATILAGSKWSVMLQKWYCYGLGTGFCSCIRKYVCESV